MTPEKFIAKWKSSKLKEMASSHEHFLDLCHLLDESTPAELDPDGTWYTFEKGVNKTMGSKGWADVWKRHHFGWEYKGKGKDLKKAFVQLQQYAIALENPPLLVVCDIDTIIIHTNFTNTIEEIHIVTLDDIAHFDSRQKLKWLFSQPEKLKPTVTREAVTQKAAQEFVSLAQQLRAQNYEAYQVAHFINQLVFCMFAEDIGLLPSNIFTRLLETVAKRPESFIPMIQDLFTAMRIGGTFGVEAIDWFNGNLFDKTEILPLDKKGIQQVLKAARMNWSQIDPSIFGTLFERGLDPDKRSQLGAHYTDAQSILRLINPVILEPLLTEWEQIKPAIAEQMVKMETAKSKSVQTKSQKTAENLCNRFLKKLRQLRILDPACGSGNFLYLALQGLKDLEHRVLIEAEALGLGKQFPDVTPHILAGIEINPYAAELARVTIWIGYIQWLLTHGFNLNKQPILQKLDNIECRDALLNVDGSEAQWPQADFIVGNPPFLGDKKMISILGEDYTTQLRQVYKGRVPGGADLVTYWFAKAGDKVKAGETQIVGLVSTNSIRGGANRKVLDRLTDYAQIFNAWSDEPWVLEGAAVRVSLVCFGLEQNKLVLNGEPVTEIFTNLTGSSAMDLTIAKRLSENIGFGFMGIARVGDFDIDGELARTWLKLPTNPNGKSNSNVLKPLTNAKSITNRPLDMWVIDFSDMTEIEASYYEQPFKYVLQYVKPFRERSRQENNRKNWWLFERPRLDLRQAIQAIQKIIATPRTAKHRLFVWLDSKILPDTAIIIIAKDDDTTFGILHSRFHEIWALRMGTSLEDRPRYTHTTTFETFPFPQNLTPNIPAKDYADNHHAQAIANAAKKLDQLRNNWLNPPELVKSVPEVVAGYSDRLLPINEDAAKELKNRTLTKLYNAKPQWLIYAHQALDKAVAQAYGWEEELSDEEILARLLKLNLERSS